MSVATAPPSGIWTLRSRGTDRRLIVEELGSMCTSIIVSVFEYLNGSPARWSEPTSRIVSGPPGLGTVTAVDTFNAGVASRYFVICLTWSRPATAVAVAANAITSTPAAANRTSEPTLDFGINHLIRAPRRSP